MSDDCTRKHVCSTIICVAVQRTCPTIPPTSLPADGPNVMTTSSSGAPSSRLILCSFGRSSMNAGGFIALSVVLTFSLGSVHAADAPKASPVLSAESRTTYEQRVLPFLMKHCWECHDERSAE